MKIGGKAKAEMVNQNLKKFQIEIQRDIQSEVKCEKTRRLVTDALSKIKGLKVKDDKKEQKSSEVD